MIRKANAVWNGSGKDGKGSLSGPSGVLDKTPYSFKTRFKNEDGKQGTNPEELIAAAHAGCFNMALSFQLGEAGFEPKSLHTEALLKVEEQDGGFAITSIQLKLKGEVDGISAEKFKEIAQQAKEGCPVSKALSAVDISLDVELA